MTEPLLTMQGVTKRFGGVQALRGVDFDLKAGEWHLPADQTKTESAIRIPLSPWVIRILEDQRTRQQRNNYSIYRWSTRRSPNCKIS